MKEMVNAFSDYARSPKINTASMDINTLVHDVVELYRGHKNISLSLDLAPQLSPVQADTGRLRQVFHNLIKNAIEAMEQTDNATIAISTTPCPARSSMVCIQIQDNGPGIPDVLRDKLFEPYVTNKEKGSGLGLAVVKKILEEHGGSISVESSPDHGTRFTLALPVDQQARAAPANFQRNQA
jgi:nitrogen fixation/metabolism regulation signal transduction histidine kinase